MNSQENNVISNFVSALENSGAIISTPSGGFTINPAVPALADFVNSLPSTLLSSSENSGDGDSDNINFNSLISGAIQDAAAGTLGATVGLGIDYNGTYYSLSSDGEMSYGTYTQLPFGLGEVDVGSSFGANTSSPLSVEYENSNGQYSGFNAGPGGLSQFAGSDTNMSTINGVTIYNQVQSPGGNTNTPLSFPELSGIPQIGGIPKLGGIPQLGGVLQEASHLPFG